MLQNFLIFVLIQISILKIEKISELNLFIRFPLISGNLRWTTLNWTVLMFIQKVIFPVLIESISDSPSKACQSPITSGIFSKLYSRQASSSLMGSYTKVFIDIYFMSALICMFRTWTGQAPLMLLQPPVNHFNLSNTVIVASININLST